jgi:tetratricopeptide (TPR) repeat protein
VATWHNALAWSIHAHYFLDGLEALDKDTTSLANTLATFFSRVQGNHAQALIWRKLVLEVEQEIYGTTPHPDVADSLNNMGVTLEAQGRYEDALKYKAQSLEMKQEIYGTKPHPYVAGSLYNMGKTLHSLGNRTEALKYAQEALVMRLELYRSSPNPRMEASIKKTERLIALIEGATAKNKQNRSPSQPRAKALTEHHEERENLRDSQVKCLLQ